MLSPSTCVEVCISTAAAALERDRPTTPDGNYVEPETVRVTLLRIREQISAALVLMDCM